MDTVKFNEVAIIAIKNIVSSIENSLNIQKDFLSMLKTLNTRIHALERTINSNHDKEKVK